MGKTRKSVWYKRAVRKMVGDNIYQNLHALKAFQSMSEPFPSQATPPDNIDWSTGLPPLERSDYLPLVYLVSPIQRSGTNFLNFMLKNHPALKVPEGTNWPEEQCLYSAAPELAAYVSQTVGYWTNWVRITTKRELHAKHLLARFGNGAISHFSNSLKPGQLPLFKTPDSGNVEWLFHMFPNVRVIILIRDGRDTVTSYINSWGGQSIFRRLVKRWAARIHEIRALQQFVERNGIKDQMCTVRYEDLLDDAPKQLRRIFEFLEIPADDYPWDSLASVPVLGSSTMKKDDQVHWKPVRKPKSFNPTGKWVAWSNYEKRVFKRYANDLLIELGYAEDDKW